MQKIKAVIFDWAGTAIDYGCFAPVKGFVDGFKSIGVEITNEMARRPMGLPKLDHVRAIAAMLPAPIPEDDIQDAYAVFERDLLANIENHCDVIDHVPDAVAALRERGVHIGSTTGYTSEMMQKALPKAAERGYAPDFCVTPDRAGKGRPYPYMIWENCRRFGISDLREVIKVGDTLADIEEGKNAGCWTAAVILGSSELGLSREAVTTLDAEALEAEKRRVRAAFYKAGADYIIDDMRGLIPAVEDIERKLAQNAARKLLTPGPLTTRDAVKRAMLTDHCTWDEEYKAITRSVMDDITAISADDSYATVLLQGSGSYVVEAMINCLTGPDEKILFLVNGEYGKRMLAIARDSGKRFDVLAFDETQPADAGALDKKLAGDGGIRAVAAVHCETTTGVLNPLEDIVRTAKKHGKKVLVDAMSSFGAYDIDMPGLDIDALAASANKCLEGLPGLAFVIAKKQLIEAGRCNALSHSLDLYDQYQGLYAGGGKFRFTSPTNILLALRQALDEYKKEGGLAARRLRYMENHRVLTRGLAALGFKAIVAPEDQSYIITTFALEGHDFARLYDVLKAEGFIIYPGKLTALPTFRLGSIGDVYPSDMEALVRTVEAYLKSE